MIRCILEVHSSFRLLLLVLSVLAPSVWTVDSAARSQDSTCSNADETCVRPRWRYMPYHGTDNELYGGEYVKDAFEQEFDGPALDDDWNVLWTFSSSGRINNLPPKPGRLWNNCNYFRAAGQKCYFAGHIRRVAEVLRQTDPDRRQRFTYLRNYVLNHAEQAKQWWQEASSNPNQTWVVKECAAGMSSGVQLLRGDELLAAAEHWKKQGYRKTNWTTAQVYLDNVFMRFGGRKFHLRVYVLITRWGPPSVLVYNEGVVFRSRHPYDLNKLSLDRDVFSMISSDVEALPHAAFWDALDSLPDVPSSASVRAHMLDIISALFGQALDQSFGKSPQPDGVGYACFDLFGLDVMFDEQLNPYILEVNLGPNLEVDDRGEEAGGFLKTVKAPLMKQLVTWMSSYVQDIPETDEDARIIEDAQLVNFTRVL